MWFKLKTYFRFLIRSFHLHGIHSPFVFQLTKNCFRGNRKQLLPNLMDYLKIESLLIFGHSKSSETEKITEKVSKPVLLTDIYELDTFLEKNSSPFDMVLFQNISEAILCATFQKTLHLAHNNSVFVFENIHCSKEMEQLWEKIKQTEKIRVSIDSFHFGFVFFRKEQAKEDFVVNGG